MPDEILPHLLDIKKQFSDLQATVIGLVHDEENNQQRMADMKENQGKLWQQFDALREKVADLEAKSFGQSNFFRLFYALLLAAGTSIITLVLSRTLGK